jgi:6-phosphogluconolactonase
MVEIEVYSDAASLATASAARFVDIARAAIEQRGRFSVALSGGSTPEATYKLLASDRFSNQFNWDRVHLFWGDERCVPPTHLHSNYRMVLQALISKIPIPVENIHRFKGEIDPATAAKLYVAELSTYFNLRLSATAHPSFDLILLGLGEDGHTASLFPNSTTLQIKDSWVAMVDHDDGPPPLVKRLTLTPHVINAAKWIIFLLSGANKSSVLRQVLSDTEIEPPLPAQLIKPSSGKLLWMVDEAAARDL